MPKVSESVEIRAAPEEVWHAVHEDLEHVPDWADNLRRVELLDGRKPGRGSHIRYEVVLPGGRSFQLEVEQQVFDKPRKCAGIVVEGPLQGDWSYTYQHARGVTTITYGMDFKLGGVLRFAGGVIAGEYAKAVRQQLAGLKQYLEV